MPVFDEDYIAVSIGGLARYAERKRRSEIARGRHYPHLPVYGPAWAILLYLFTEGCRGFTAKLGAVYMAASVSGTTGHRHVLALVDGGDVIRQDDPKDARASKLQLAPKAMAVVAEALAEELSLTWGRPVRIMGDPWPRLNENPFSQGKSSFIMSQTESLNLLCDKVDDIKSDVQSISDELRRHIDALER